MKLCFLCRKCGQSVKETKIEMYLSNSPAGNYLTITLWCEDCKIWTSYKFKGE